jgi:N5-(cytidine 5'-diphosphoramidyl)-L-glutamine hydrolase
MANQTKPVVALSMRITEAAQYPERRDTISHDWIKYLDAWRVIPVMVPNILDNPVAFLEHVKPNLLVLTGGDDLGDTPERDDTEIAMLDYALQEDLAVLGVCRGLQVINTHLRGTLTEVNGHVGQSHFISVTPHWAALYGEKVEVNSFHTKGIKKDGLANDLVATAIDDENHVEAFCHQSKPVAAVMWHPERDGAPKADHLLFSRLIDNGAF